MKQEDVFLRTAFVNTQDLCDHGAPKMLRQDQSVGK